MRFAIVNNERTLPSPKMNGSCPVCASPVIAKCGNVKIHHWAHFGRRVCDQWWEPETEWHRDWKMNFPSEWQEVIRYAASGEKHVADIRTELDLTIEFQHSHIRPEERAAREAFYENMIWVVDGRRLVRDLPRFTEARRMLRPIIKKGIYIHPFPEELFPRDWLSAKARVFFDFNERGDSGGPPSYDSRSLWCLLPHRVESQAIIYEISNSAFVRLAHDAPKHLFGGAILVQIIRRMIEAQHARRRDRPSDRSNLGRGRYFGQPRLVNRRRYPRF